MSEFKYLNYFAHYTSKGSNNIRSSKNEVCFSRVFIDIGRIQDNIYHIYIYKDVAMARQYSIDNNCILSKEELSHHLNIMKQIMPFNYRITNKTVKYNGTSMACFVVMLHVKGYNIKHRFILTWLRYAYEFPYNVMIKDAYKAKKESGLKSISIFNLIQLIGESSQFNVYGGHSMSSFTDFHNMISNKALKTYLNDPDKRALNGILNLFNYNALDRKRIHFKEVPNRDDKYELNYWESDDEYKDRLEIYKYNYKIKKQYGKKIK